MIAIVSNTAVPPWARLIPAPDPCSASATQVPRLQLSRCDRGTERERHGAFDGATAMDARDAFEETHAAAQPNHRRFDDHDVAWMHRMTVAHALDAGEEGKPLPVLGFRQHEDRA